MSEARGVPRASGDDSNLPSNPSLRKDLNRGPRVAVFRGELKLDRTRVVRVVRFGNQEIGIHVHF